MRPYKILSAGIVSLFLLAGSVCADDVVHQIVGPFGGLNNTDNPLTIPSDRAQDLLNVDISPNGKSVKKREGYGLANTLTISTSPVHGTYSFYDANGSEVSLYFNDRYLTGSIGGSLTTVLFSTGTYNATWQCIDSQGFAYCVSSSREPIIKTQGTTDVGIAANANGSIIAVTPERLVLAGFSSAPNRIDFSKANDFSTWTPGGQPTSPDQETITSPGSRITHLTYQFDRLMWFKDASFGYILFGPTLADWQIVVVDPTIGTLDNSSVYRNGLLYFRGQDGHYYAYDGSGVTKLSRDIGTTVNASQTRIENSWMQTTSEDFGAGSFSPNIVGDTVTSSGNIYLSFPDYFDSIRDGSAGTKPVWQKFTTSGATGTFSTSGGYLTITSTGGSLGSIGLRTAEITNDFQPGTTYHFLLNALSRADASSTVRAYFILSPTYNGTQNPNALANKFELLFLSTYQPVASLSRYYLSSVSNTSDGTLYSTSAVTATNYSSGLVIDLYLSTSSYQISMNDVVIKAGSHTWTHTPVYLYLTYLNGSNFTGSAVFDNFGVARDTVTFQSSVRNAPNLSSWENFIANYSNGGTGEHRFYVRSATGVFTVNSATPTWALSTSGSLPAASTGTYLQFRDDIRVSTWTDAPYLSDFTISWFEGQASDKAYGIYHNDAIWWAIASGTGVTTNNRIARLDLINNAWTLYDIGSNGFLKRNGSLYFGSSSGGYVYKFGGSTSDNGAAINAYWKSKDFFGSDPFTDKELVNVSVSAASVANSSGTLTYTIDGSSSTSLTVPFYSVSSFTKVNRNVPLGKVGSTFNFQIGNNASNQPFEVFGIEYGLRPKPWKPNP